MTDLILALIDLAKHQIDKKCSSISKAMIYLFLIALLASVVQGAVFINSNAVSWFEIILISLSFAFFVVLLGLIYVLFSRRDAGVKPDKLRNRKLD